MEVKYRTKNVQFGPSAPPPPPTPGLTCVASRKTSRSGDKKVRKPALHYPLRSLLTDPPKVV